MRPAGAGGGAAGTESGGSGGSGGVVSAAGAGGSMIGGAGASGLGGTKTDAGNPMTPPVQVAACDKLPAAESSKRSPRPM
jgi:hypothetical protein